MPTMSIIIPVFNRPKLLKETIRSVQVQSYPDWECLLVDDGSDDETLSFIESTCAGDPRFLFIPRDRPPKGAPTCRNIGKEAAQGTFVLFLDSDDLLAPWCLKSRVAEMELHPDVDVGLFQGLAFHHQPLDQKHFANKFQEETPGEDMLAMYLQREINWHTTAPLWRRDFVKNISWDEAASHWQDREFHIQALLHHAQVFVSSTLPDYFKRSGGGNNVSSRINELDQLRNRVGIYNRIFRELPASHIAIFKQQVQHESKSWVADHSAEGTTNYRHIVDVLQPLTDSFEVPSAKMKTMGRLLGWLGNLKVPYVRGLLIQLWVGRFRRSRKQPAICPTSKLVAVQHELQLQNK